MIPKFDLLPTKKTRMSRESTQGPGAADDGDTEYSPLYASHELTEETMQETLHKGDGQPPSSPIRAVKKRQISNDHDHDHDNGHQSKRTQLTRINLARLNRMTKKRNQGSASASSESTDNESLTELSTGASGFANRAYKNGILDPLSSKPPANLEEIRDRLDKSRASSSPPESVYRDYVHKVAGAINEATMVGEMLPLFKTYLEDSYVRALDQSFTGFPKNVGFNDGLSNPHPGYVEGLRVDEYRPFPIDEYVEVAEAVLYKDNPHSLTLPLVAGECKGSGKDMEGARLQSAYNGAALVYARNKALAHIEQSDLPDYAEVTTFATDGTTINFFAHYARESEHGTIEYHQYPITSTNLKNSYEEFKQGRKALRNIQDYARKQSYALKDKLMKRWKHATPTSHVGNDHEARVKDFVA